jgi:hypothetical protein
MIHTKQQGIKLDFAIENGRPVNVEYGNHDGKT